MNRQKTVIRTSILGIAANLLLSAAKAAVGLLAGSIAIVLDAVNNLSDALSSVITIIGTKLAGKQADKKHPFGHGRIEYLTASIIALIVLYAGLTSLVESIKKILAPQTPDYSAVSLIVVALAVCVKVGLGLYVQRVGVRVRSDALTASGKDALGDAVISAATLVAAGVYLLWQLRLEAWLGALISLYIIKSGVEILSRTISQILGERAESRTSVEIKRTILSFPDVSGAYDLVLHSYGPDMLIGSVHIEVPDTYTADRLDALERDIVQKVLTEHGVILTGISVYALNTKNEAVSLLREDIRRTVMAHEEVLQMHGFYAQDREIRFDIIIDYEVPDRLERYSAILREIRDKYPDYDVSITLDADAGD